MNSPEMIGKSVRLVVYLVSFILIQSCDKLIEEPSSKNAFDYNFLSYENIIQHLEFPSGLCHSRRNNTKNLKDDHNELNGIIATGPTFQNLWANGGLQKYENPKIFRFTSSRLKSTLNFPVEVNLSLLSEIDLGKYPNDFDSFAYSNFPDSLWRARGLTLDGVELKNGAVICSSNSTDKLFIINELGQNDVYIQDDRLMGITKIIQGTDDNIYLAAVESVDDDDSSLIISPKRIVKISLADKSINVEFELPSSINFNNIFEDYPGQLKIEASYTERLKICENSNVGKAKNGFKFYVSDLLYNRIYGINEQNLVAIIAENIRFPYLLGVDSIGNIFYATSPMSKGMFYPVEIRFIDLAKNETKTVYTFKETLGDYINCRGLEVIGDDGRRGFILLLGFDISGIIQEKANTLVSRHI